MSGRIRYRECKVCGARRPFVSISSRGLCPDHSRIRQIENVTAMVTRDGPNWNRWKRGMARAAGLIMLDEAREQS